MLLKWSAVFPFDAVSSSAWINSLYRCYMIFNVALFLFVSLFLPGYFFANDYSLEDAIEVMSIVMTQIRNGTKLLTFVLYRKEIRNLISALYKNFYIRGKELDAEESRIVQEAIENARIVSIGYFALLCSTSTAMILHPLTFKPTEMDQEGALNHTAGPSRILPLKFYFPKWNSTTSPQYEIEYVVQIMLAGFEALYVGSIDSFGATIMIFVGCQFDLLCKSLMKINKDESLKSGIETHEKRTEIYSKQTLVVDKNSTLRMKAERVGSKIRNHMNDSDGLNDWHERTSQDTDMEFEGEEGKHMLLTANCYEQTEREAIAYVKECIRHHQSLLM